MPFFILLTLLMTAFAGPSPAGAATSDTLNFQGRLLTNTGALVPDGSYNIEFNLYSVDTGGSTLWTESRTGGNALDVQNGYFSAYLGDVTAFPSSIPWDQELWLTMNVNGDGEMSPRFKLTAVPYAFRAGALVDGSGNAKTADDFAQLAPTSVQTVNSALAALRLNQTGAGSLLQLQGDGSDVFTVDKTGNATLAGGLTLGNSTPTTAGTIRWTGTDFEGFNGSGWDSLTGGGGGGGGLSDPAAATFYDLAGGSVIASGTFSTINLDSTLENSDPGIISLASDTVTVLEDGYYQISYDVTARLNSGTRSGFNTKLQRDNGGGFLDVPGSQAYHYGRITSETQGTSSATVVLDLSAGDSVRIQGRGTSESFSTISGASRITVIKLAAGGTSGDAFIDGGNSFGSTAILGTTDTNGLQIVTDSNVVLDIDAVGDATFTGALDVDGLLTLNNGLEITSGNLDLNGGDILNAGSVTATSFTGNGSGLTALNADEITTGTINDARLSSNVALLDVAQTYTGLSNFSTGLRVGNTIDTTAGNIRWTGTDLEVYDGSGWVSLTSGGSVDPAGDYISVTTTANSTASTALYDVFQTSSYPSYSSTTNASNGIVYTPADGRFTIATDGVYNIGVNYMLESSANALTNLIIQVNGVNVFNNDTFVHSAVDPVERSATIVQDLTAGDYIEFFVDGTTGNITTHGGTSATIVPVSAASGGGGGGGGTSFEQGGNAFGSLAILGTTDTNGLQIVTDSNVVLDIDAVGDATFTGALDVDGLLTLNNGLEITSGNLDLNGGDILNAGSVTATSFTGNGSGLTALNADEITTGTINDARLSSNVALLDVAQAFSDTQTFSGGAVLGNFVSSTAGAIRWTGADFEGYDGTDWVSLTGGGESLLEGVLAFGKVAGNGTAFNIDGASVVRNSTGQYTVTFDTPATDADYTVLLSLADTAAYNDINIVLSAQSNTAFNVSIVTGDNGTGNDVAADRVWHFTVLDTNAVSGGGGGGGGGGTSFDQNGNSFGATGILGTTDAFGLRIVSGGNNALEFDASGIGTFSNGFSVTSGALDLNAVGINDAGTISAATTGDTINGIIINSGTISASTTGDTINGLIINSGSLSGISGYDQSSGNFSISGSGTFSTGTGAVDLNGAVTAATTLDVGNGLSVAGTNSYVSSIGYFEGAITTGTAGGTALNETYTFDADNDADESAWTFNSPQGGGLQAAGGSNGFWVHDTDDTPSADVGPTSGQGGNPDGYVYTEASAPGAFNDVFTMTYNTVLDASTIDWDLSFYWNQRGNDNTATLNVQTNEGGGGWVTRATYGGGDQATGAAQVWNFETIDLAGVISDPSTQIRFVVTFPAAGTAWNNDFGLDTITINGASATTYGDNLIEGYNANATSDVDLLVLRSDVGSAGNVVFRVDSDGDVFSDGVNNLAAGADIAENYKNTDGAQPGDVVYFTDNRTVAKTNQQYQKGLAGVISSDAAIILDAGVNGVPVGLKGRLPTKVSVANGSIEKGDYLTSGPDGRAVKATQSGTVIGIAMENATEDTTIDVFVGLTYYVAEADYNIPAEGLQFPQAYNDIDVDSIATDGIIRLTREGELVNINGITLLAGGIDNNFSGLRAVGNVLGAWTVDAKLLKLNGQSAEEDVLQVAYNENNALTIAGNGALGLQLNSDNAFSVKNQSGLDLFSVNTNGGVVQIGNSQPDPSAVLFILSRQNTKDDPVGVNGAQYYNEYLQKFRCFENDKWVDCITSVLSEYVIATDISDWTLENEESELPGNPRTWLDLRRAEEQRIVVSVKDPSVVGAVCSLQYEGQDDWSMLGVPVLIDASQTVKSDWQQLPEQVRDSEEVQLRVVCTGGDGQKVVSLSAVRIQVR